MRPYIITAVAISVSVALLVVLLVYFLYYKKRAIYSVWYNSPGAVCSAECGSGTIAMKRECLQGKCKDPLEKKEPCKIKDCCELGDPLLCEIMGNKGGSVARPEASCVQGVCCEYTNWGAWSDCNVLNVSSRERELINSHNNPVCDKTSERKRCEYDPTKK